jgi:predicted NAD-dependent protein-ADP-ribosyltransferase YbiA (DUF1768 family)
MSYPNDPLGLSHIHGHEDPQAMHKRWADQARLASESFQRGRDVSDAARAALDQAKDAVASLTALVARFQQELKDGQELRLQTSGAGLPFFPGYVQAVGVDRILFVGKAEDGSNVMVMQHVSQLNVMLRAVKVESGEPRRADLGFHHPG